MDLTISVFLIITSLSCAYLIVSLKELLSLDYNEDDFFIKTEVIFAIALIISYIILKILSLYGN